MKQIKLSWLLLGFPVFLAAQPDASDGIYDKFVLVRWHPIEPTDEYKVFRATDPSLKSLQEISKNWQSSTWLCDYTAQPGVDYYYAVAAKSQMGGTAISKPDKGFVKKQLPVATEEQMLGSNERYAEKQRYFLLVGKLSPHQDLYTPGDTVLLSAELENIFDRPIYETQIRLFLSTDKQLDWDDIQLTEQPIIYSDFPPEAKHIVDLPAILPKGIRPGFWYLIVASSSGKELVESRVAFVEILIN